MSGEKLNYQVKKCTPIALKVYEKFGLAEYDPNKFLKNWSLVIHKIENLKTLCVALFGKEFESVDYQNEIDLSRVLEGVIFFGHSVLGISRAWKRSTMNSPALQPAGSSLN